MARERTAATSSDSNSLRTGHRQRKTDLQTQLDRVALLGGRYRMQQFDFSPKLAKGFSVGKSLAGFFACQRAVMRSGSQNACMFKVVGKLRRHFVSLLAALDDDLFRDSLTPAAVASLRSPINSSGTIQVMGKFIWGSICTLA